MSTDAILAILNKVQKKKKCVCGPGFGFESTLMFLTTKISFLSIHNFLRYLVDNQTDKQIISLAEITKR